jgi:para-nitrobenzyl esterase
MVWIHGGSNVHGWGGDPFFDGSVLARRGVVVVSVNYRLGVLGFLTHPALSAESAHGVSGNYGLLDQIAALGWVRRNIAAFGGDSSRVTLFGQSAGATNIGCLLTSPLVTGLFHRAILQSGACGSAWLDGRRGATGISEPDSLGLRLSRALGLSDDAAGLAALRALGVDTLRAASDTLGITFDPVVDGRVLPDQPVDRAERGELLPVPVIVGSNADEASSLVPQGFPPDTLVLRRVFARDYGAAADSVLALYPAHDQPSARRALVERRTDEWLEQPARATAAALARAGVSAYLYRLARGAPVGDRRGAYGAFHGAELPFVFGTNPAGWSYVAEESDLGRLVRDYWVAFATTGDPNRTGLPTWPRFEPETSLLLELDRTPRPRPARDNRLDWIESRLRRDNVR